MIENIKQFTEQVNDVLENKDIKMLYKHFLTINTNKNEFPFNPTDASTMACIKYHCNKQLGLNAYDVQIEAAIRLHEGNIIEMGTGEGKTLVAIMSSLMHLMNKRKVHIVTANDYLAYRDYRFAKPVFESLGYTCGCIQDASTQEERIQSAKWDVVYTTNKEIAINFSNNRKTTNPNDLIQSPFDVLIVDEADLIMIDEARKELSVGNNYEVNQELFRQAKAFVQSLEEDDTIINQQSRDFKLTEKGLLKAQEFFGTDDYFEPSYAEGRTAIKVAFLADKFYTKDIDYIVHENEIVLINKQTGRTMNYYKMLNGLQQALECKENLPISKLRTSFTKIPYQFIFNRYEFKSGMTGSAMTESDEFKEIYNLNVVKIPPHKPNNRIDNPDRLFVTNEARNKAVIEKVIELHNKKQPVIIGTNTIEHSECIGKLLDEKKISYQLLNAKNHASEAEIIENAGKPGTVTIATNMAGRGTDIKIPKESLKVGGLFIIGTERGSSRRADNQLRGRAGRQGDVGETQFYTSLEDEIVSSINMNQIERLMKVLKNVGDKDYIENPSILALYNKAQIAREGHNFNERKEMLSNSNLLLTHYQNFFGRKLYLMQTKPTLHDFYSKLLRDYIKDKPYYERYFGLNFYNQVDINCSNAINIIDFETIYSKFNSYWTDFINQIEILDISNMLNFSTLGDYNLIYQKKLNECYSMIILKMKQELILMMQNKRA